MGNLSQKDLINRQLYDEGIGSMIGGLARTGASRLGKIGRGLGSIMAPKTAEALGKLGQAISSDFVQVMAANPKNGLRSWLNSAEGSRLFKDVSLGGEKKLQNNDVQIKFKGKYIDPMTPDEAKDTSGTFMVRPDDKEKGSWGIMGANDNEGNVIWAPSKKRTGEKGGEENPYGWKDGPEKPKPGGPGAKPITLDGPEGEPPNTKTLAPASDTVPSVTVKVSVVPLRVRV